MVPYQTQYQWGSVYGAADLVSGEVEFLFLPTVTKPASQLFLEQLVATAPQAIHVVRWDQAGFHSTPEDHQIPQQVR